MNRIWILLLLLLTSCTTGQTIQEIDRPVRDLQQVADKALPVGRAKVSRNGRVFTSVFFVTDKGKWVAYNGEPARYYAEIKVLGSRRPYTMNVAIYEQKSLGNKQFAQPEFKESLTRVLYRRVKQTLHGSGLDRNVIDDFKVF